VKPARPEPGSSGPAPNGTDFLGLLIADEDNLPCVEREWRLPDFEEELTDLCSRAWLASASVVGRVLKWLGEEPEEHTLACRPPGREYRRKLYNRDRLIEEVAVVRK
jgi:hypothetical protein